MNEALLQAGRVAGGAGKRAEGCPGRWGGGLVGGVEKLVRLPGLDGRHWGGLSRATASFRI